MSKGDPLAHKRLWRNGPTPGGLFALVGLSALLFWMVAHWGDKNPPALKQKPAEAGEDE